MKRILAIALALCLLVPLAACAAKPAPAKTLTLGALPSIDVIPFVLAEKRGTFKKYGLDFKLQLFKSAKDRDAAFQAGALDGICCDEVAVCLYRAAGVDLRITGMTEGEYALVAGKASGVTDVAGLKGKSVAISEKTLIEYILDSMLAKNGLQPSDVSKTAVPPLTVRLEALNQGQADAALLPEPFATFAVNAGGTRLSSATQIGLYPSVIAFTKQVIDARRADIAAMYRAYDDAADYINGTPVAQYEDAVIEAAGYPEDMRGRIVLPKFSKGTMPAESDIRSVIDWAASKGLCDPSLDPNGFVEPVR